MRDHDDAKLTAGEDVASFFRSSLAVERGREDALNRGGFTKDVDVPRPQCGEEKEVLGK